MAEMAMVHRQPRTWTRGQNRAASGDRQHRPDFRDVDIRTILADDHYDELFKDREFFWSIVCLGISSYLSDVSGLPVDYQIQRMTEANEKHDKPRCAMGLGAVLFAGGGDG